MPETTTRALRGLYAITPDGLPLATLLQQAEAALRGGAAALQYRDKQASPPQRDAAARALRCLCRKYGTFFIVNDDPALALAVDADGVHLGADDGDLRAARHALRPGMLLGASCYADFELARRARAAGADYLAFGAVFASSTKPLACPAPLSLFARCRSELAAPACAIGGITAENAPLLLNAGADLLAVISDLFSATDISSRAATYHHLFEEKP